MPDSVALMGLGMAAQQAALIGAAPNARGAGAGTAQVGAKTVLSKNTEVTPTAGQTAYILPAGSIFENYQFFNSAATAVSALIYSPVGSTMNGSASTSTPVTIPQNKCAIIWQYKPGFWTSIIAA